MSIWCSLLKSLITMPSSSSSPSMALPVPEASIRIALIAIAILAVATTSVVASPPALSSSDSPSTSPAVSSWSALLAVAGMDVSLDSSVSFTEVIARVRAAGLLSGAGPNSCVHHFIRSERVEFCTYQSVLHFASVVVPGVSLAVKHMHHACLL